MHTGRLHKHRSFHVCVCKHYISPMSEFPKTEWDGAQAGNSVAQLGRPQPKRKVCFDEDNLVSTRLFEFRLELGEKEMLWYSHDEIKRQREFDRYLLQMVLDSTAQYGASPDLLLKIVGKLGTQAGRLEAAWDIRGLEHLIDGGKLREQAKLESYLAVFSMEPSKLGASPTLREERLSSVQYHNIAKNSVLAARRRAALDRAFIDNDMDQELTMKQPSSSCIPALPARMHSRAGPCAA